MFGTIEILALIGIVLMVFKLFFMLFKPKEGVSFARTALKYHVVMYYSAFLGAVVILYFLYTAGVRIVEILAVALFLKMLYGMALIPFSKQMCVGLDLKKKVPELWLVIAFSIVLIAWGLKELFF